MLLLKSPTGRALSRSPTDWRSKRLHQRLDEFARRFCPIHRAFGGAYHWSVDQCEYATEVVFKRQAELAAIYGNLSRTAIHARQAR